MTLLKCQKNPRFGRGGTLIGPDRTSATSVDLGMSSVRGGGELAGDCPKLAEMTLKFADPSVVDLRPRDRPGRNLGRSAFLGGKLGFPGLDRRIQIWSTFAALQCDVIKFGLSLQCRD